MGNETRNGQTIDNGNLPLDLAVFVGRDDALATAAELLRRERLLTLTGPGGVGKTRLAQRIASHLRTEFTDGAWIIDVGELEGGDDHSADWLYTHVALALGLRRHGPATLEVLRTHLHDRRALLIVDSCEYLLPRTRDLVSQLLRSTRHLRVVATSRQPLGIDGERTMPVPPLSTRDAVHLFTDRAIAAGSPPASLADTDAIQRLCQRLDGLPLAIRLAAGRTRTLSVQELIDRLDDRFRLLTAPAHGNDERHSTLGRVVDLSYDMCTRQEQQAWTHISIFAGTFDLAAAEAVIAGDDINQASVVDLIAGLIDKSVITVDTTAKPSRYTMLDTLRDYGRRRLAASTEALAVRTRHRAHYRRWLEHAVATWLGPAELETLASVRRELREILNAIDHSITDGDLATARALARDLTRTRAPFFWGFMGLAFNQLERAIDASNPNPDQPAEASDLAATAAAAAWIAAAQGRRKTARTLLGSADTWLRAHHLPANPPLLFTRGGSDALLAGHREAIGLLAAARDQFTDPATAGDRHMATMMWSIAYAFAGEPNAAENAADRYLDEAEKAAAPWAISWALWAAALAALRCDDLERATTAIARCLQLQRDMGDQWGQTWSIELAAWITAARLHDHPEPERQARRAAWLLGAAMARQEKLGVLLSELRPLAARREQARARIAEHLDESTITREAAAGKHSHKHAIRHALNEPTSRRPRASTEDGPTPRELEVVDLVAQGLSSSEIGRRLRISHRTVDTHLTNLSARLGLHNRVELTRWYINFTGANPVERAPKSTGLCHER
ncbi:ATP-binding protein, partial [Paractinoplanes toevensis]|uniref:ATP-binding protein n=1 Tax=Paractinoplanes toevensis TaxID=571911 RepID=UPI001BB371A8